MSFFSFFFFEFLLFRDISILFFSSHLMGSKKNKSFCPFLYLHKPINGKIQENDFLTIGLNIFLTLLSFTRRKI